MGDLIRTIGDFRVNNLAQDFGTRAESVELIFAIIMMLGGIILTYLIQRWADRAGKFSLPRTLDSCVGLRTHEDRTIRE
ncbi:MAG: hypothetical protein R2848_09740 [Thermomicrobiales bacterium]